MTANIEWSAGSEGVKQTVYSDDDHSLVITLDNKGITISLHAGGVVVNDMHDTYEDLMKFLGKKED